MTLVQLIWETMDLLLIQKLLVDRAPSTDPGANSNPIPTPPPHFVEKGGKPDPVSVHRGAVNQQQQNTVQHHTPSQLFKISESQNCVRCSVFVKYSLSYFLNCNSKLTSAIDVAARSTVEVLAGVLYFQYNSTPRTR